MFKKLALICFLILLVAIFLIINGRRNLKSVGNQQTAIEKVYVAIEGEGKIAVIDPAKQSVILNIDLSQDHEGGKMKYTPHNIQVAGDGSSVWVTANASGHQDHSSMFLGSVFANGDSHTEDEVIVIDPKTDKIIKRIPIDIELHLAHVAISPDGSNAYVTAQKEGSIYKINTKEYHIEKRIKVPQGYEPHGLRIAPDGSIAAVAMLQGKSIGILDLKNDKLSQVELNGQPVQTAITPDGKFILAALFDIKKIAKYDLKQKLLRYISLPKSSKGPLQLYPTPDSRFIYVADQGYYFDQPQGQLVYKIDVNQGEVIKEITAGDAPHGVVVSKDGKFVYITNLISGDVSIIDATTDQQIAKIPVGREPNGISIWTKDKGGTP